MLKNAFENQMRRWFETQLALKIGILYGKGQ
jgi:hypothetical protein